MKGGLKEHNMKKNLAKALPLFVERELRRVPVLTPQDRTILDDAVALTPFERLAMIARARRALASRGVK